MIATDPFWSPDFLVSESMLTGRKYSHICVNPLFGLFLACKKYIPLQQEHVQEAKRLAIL